MDLQDIKDAWHAHQEHAITESKRFRKCDGITPSTYHALWCATTNATETSQHLIGLMTFEGGNAEKIENIWKRLKVIRLYKLYDTVSNLLEGNWMNTDKRKLYTAYATRPLYDTTEKFWALHITRIATGVLQ